jgi:hypothetical protein
VQVLAIIQEGGCTCCDAQISDLMSLQVPGSQTCRDSIGSTESWGLATAVVANGYPWANFGGRIIVPVSDEAPCGGDPCNSADSSAIANAIAVASAHGVFVNPVTGLGASSCVMNYADDLAAGTCGSAFHVEDGLSYGQIGAALVDVIAAQLAPYCPHCDCPGDMDCNGTVNVLDLVDLILAWGSADPFADIDRTQEVDVADLLLLIQAWGDCP